MDEIEALQNRLVQDQNTDAVRINIAELIGRLVSERRAHFGYWEKFWFAQAIMSLSGNIRGGLQQSTAGLQLALVAARNAITPDNERDEGYTPRITSIEALTVEQLLGEVRTLGGAA